MTDLTVNEITSLDLKLKLRFLLNDIPIVAGTTNNNISNADISEGENIIDISVNRKNGIYEKDAANQDSQILEILTDENILNLKK